MSCVPGGSLRNGDSLALLSSTLNSGLFIRGIRLVFFLGGAIAVVIRESCARQSGQIFEVVERRAEGQKWDKSRSRGSLTPFHFSPSCFMPFIHRLLTRTPVTSQLAFSVMSTNSMAFRVHSGRVQGNCVGENINRSHIP